MKNKIGVCFGIMLSLTMGLFVEALALLTYPIYPFAFLTFLFCIYSGVCSFFCTGLIKGTISKYFN
ncbi:hypothetical protein KPL39_05560 [Clostridium gasigenes]|uniref:hypothetical protein n=1 Tax=Clostridium gasigenes TaxID=94869 RepID=UPI001C0C10B7|nr:hypothetical protein [Clostridium gasigenes]MBU3135732.1 hypothetical protein [Clostridium gasigenes]